MDSEHRHELKENDLAIAIGSFKDWWAKHQMKVLTIAVVLAALILAVRWFTAKSSADRETELYELASAPTPEAFRALAQSTGDDMLAVQANLRGADAILPKARKPIGTGKDEITAEDKKKMLDNAESMYKAVLDGSKHPLVRIKAYLGLAAISENRGDWAKAKEHYASVQKEGKEGGYEYLHGRAAAFAAVLPRVQIEPIYGKEAPKNATGDTKLPFTGDTKDGKDDAKDGKSLIPPINLLPEKDAKTPPPEKDAKDAKDAKSPLLPPLVPEKDAKGLNLLPEKDAKAPTPEKDAKTPEKDAK